MKARVALRTTCIALEDKVVSDEGHGTTRGIGVNEQRIDFSLGLLRAGSLTPVPLYSILSSNNYHWVGLLFTLWFSSPRLFVCSSAGISSGFIEGTLRYGPGSNENITVPMPRSSSSAFWHSAST
ncbi:hypothetical protein KQX54_010967 [Cotesia glomerata]|uniref:Uncharacterized protein n=1 Tax=Cotesia glomerata TaxID=32391 RepID=A0AAV7J681_COTGL|nr:hypothetical protein KQX54_010967 [Cotesia glomerata]